MTDSSSYDHFLRGVLFGATVCFIINTIFYLIDKTIKNSCEIEELFSRLEKNHESSQDS